MAFDFKNLLTRTISGVILVALIVSVLYFAPVIPGGLFIFGAFFSFIMIVCIMEYMKISTGENAYVNTFFAVVPALLFLWGNILNYQTWQCDGFNIFVLPDLLVGLSLAFGAIYVVSALLFQNKMVDFKALLVSLLYIALPFSLFSRIEFDVFSENYSGLYYALGMFVIIWFNDTFAYLVGSVVGKHKMCPSISPKKSWEGFAGGFAGALLAGILMHWLSGYHNLAVWLVYAVVVSVFAVFGDLYESVLKRKYDVKDSGNIIPGHGGMLDRFDSFLFAVIGAAIYVYLICF